MFVAFRPMFYELLTLRRYKDLMFCRTFDGRIHEGIPDLTLRPKKNVIFKWFGVTMYLMYSLV
jgi:hypothetical protein